MQNDYFTRVNLIEQTLNIPLNFFEESSKNQIDILLSEPGFFASNLQDKLAEIYWRAAFNSVKSLFGNLQGPLPTSVRPAFFKTWAQQFKMARQVIWGPSFSDGFTMIWLDPKNEGALANNTRINDALDVLLQTQKKWAKELKKYLHELAKAIDEVLGLIVPDFRPEFLFLARGSQARGDVASYSDLECAIVTEEMLEPSSNQLLYLSTWARCLSFEIKMLGEDIPENRGFHLDQDIFASKLFFTPKQFLHADKEEPFLNQYKIIYGKKTLLAKEFLTAYQQEINLTRKDLAILKLEKMLIQEGGGPEPELADILGDVSDFQENTGKIDTRALLYNLDNFKKQIVAGKLAIKKNLLSHINWFILSLSYGYALKDQHPLENINNLEQLKVFSPGFWRLTKEFWGKLQYLRCEMQRINNNEVDVLDLNKITNNYNINIKDNIQNWLLFHLLPFYRTIYLASKHAYEYFKKDNYYNRQYLQKEYHPALEFLIIIMQKFNASLTDVDISANWKKWLKDPQQNQLIEPLCKQLKIGHNIYAAKIEYLAIIQAEKKLISAFIHAKSGQDYYPYWQTKTNFTFPPQSKLVRYDLSYQPSLKLAVYKTKAGYEKTNFRGANLSYSRAASTSFREANLSKCILEYGDFSYADLFATDLTDANAKNAIFDGANMHKCVARKVNFENASCRGTNMVGANLDAAEWKGTDLAGANLTDATIDLENLSSAKNIDGLILLNFKNKNKLKKLCESFKLKNGVLPSIITDLKELPTIYKRLNIPINLSCITFNLDLRDITLSEVKFSKAIFKKSKLHNARFSSAEGQVSLWKKITLTASDLEGDFSESLFEKSNLDDVKLLGDFNSTKFIKPNIKNSKLLALLTKSCFSTPQIFHSEIMLANDVIFEDGKLEHVKLLSNKYHSNIRFNKIKLKHCIFEAYFLNSAFDFSSLEHCKFSKNLDSVSFQACILKDITYENIKLEHVAFSAKIIDLLVFDKCFLYDVNFNDITITNVFFKNSQLVSINFKHSVLINIDFSGAVMKKVDFANAIFSDKVKFDEAEASGDFSEVINFKGASFKNSVLFGAKLFDLKKKLKPDLSQASSLSGAFLPQEYLDYLFTNDRSAYDLLINKQIIKPDNEIYKQRYEQWSNGRNPENRTLKTTEKGLNTLKLKLQRDKRHSIRFSEEFKLASENENIQTINLPKEPSLSLLHLVVKNGEINEVNSMLDDLEIVSLYINAEVKNIGTPLHLAAIYDYAEIAMALLLKGANLNYANSEGQVPLHIAVIHASLKTLTCFLEQKNLAIDAIDPQGNTALHLAVKEYNSEITNLLLQKQARVDLLNKDGYAPLHLAVLNYQPQTIKLLAIKDKLILTHKGDTALHLAILIGNEDTINFLLNEKFSLLVKNKEGRTGLHLATLLNQQSVVKLLLKYPNNIELRDNAGYKPLDYAKRNGNTVIMEMLRNYEKFKIDINNNEKVEKNKMGNATVKLEEKNSDFPGFFFPVGSGISSITGVLDKQELSPEELSETNSSRWSTKNF